MLSIVDLNVQIEEKNILDGINLDVAAGEVHAVMGPNGSGKSTLANVITGKVEDVERGSVTFNGVNLLELDPEERAREGIFLAFQHPIEIPGVNNIYLIKAAVNAMRKHRGESELDAIDFLKVVREKMKLLEINESFLYRSVNEGFSGGEKKRNEILQMMMLEPKLAVMDETDSGLDIDALKIVSKGVNSLADAGRSCIIITHFPRILEYIVPDHVHVLVGGRIVRSGDRNLAHELEQFGYTWVVEETAAEVA
ncbi:MAG: Fe-S cluster assembly ATPase SufC [Acidiferrobacterales bacterium]|nr:Fe-S cluster assembly ATPase SufC [Acidiferrobacterales bacterium]